MYRLHYDAVGRFVRRRAADLDCDNIVGQVMTIAWQSRENVPADHPLPWLYRTARNVLANEFRRRKRERNDPYDPGSDPLATMADRDDRPSGIVDRMALRQALAELGDRDREILELIAWEGLTVPEVAQVLGLGRTAVSNRVARLRKLWDPQPNRAHQLVTLLGRRTRR
ncbi:DNA-directed RNA polymerase sigma-70 factor [Asanoa ishikariensis]|uniref:RNA polymerase sigma-70 factor, ECF subfamily n=1 Tax=Asanoa ishikariensis TaxID=137265 RepID=A0A1H3UHG3_9ACTN|nr:sigma-70 family RNA polymerase sigma factor [Asanoa ishikariensis]GIF63505.1 DNA-directed RNA polymerase sigma-70 factor [Asanoa ishikariensis]SDZ61893.1 RNA polymerase sigma-70 factor, ECF subfamily [Asanoa ishikariensis]